MRGFGQDPSGEGRKLPGRASSCETPGDCGARTAMQSSFCPGRARRAAGAGPGQKRAPSPAPLARGPGRPLPRRADGRYAR